MMNVYGHWQRRLAGEVLPLENENPMPGFYRMRRKEGLPIPVAYWQQGDVVRCRVGDTDVSIERGNDVWTSCCAHPISEDAYRAVAERGEPWPDIDPTVSEQARHGMGGNRPPDGDELIREQITSAKAGVATYVTVTSDEQAAQAQTLRSRLLELKAAAEKAHKIEKQPYLDAGRAVDARWLPLVKEAQTAADAIRGALSAFETDKLRKQQAEAQAAARLAMEAQAAGIPAPLPPPTPAAPTKIKGAVGKAASVGVVKIVTVMDFDAVYHNFKANPDLQKLLTKLAQNAVDAGYPCPGVTVTEERRVR